MGSYSNNMTGIREMTILTMTLLLVSMTMSMPPYFSSRGVCVSSLCSNDGDLLCETLCAILVGDTEGIQENNNNNKTTHIKNTNNNRKNKNMETTTKIKKI